MNNILVTGGAGYIGSHTVVCLLEAGYQVVVVDNLSNSSRESLTRVQQITGKTVNFIQADIRDRSALDQLFSRYSIDAVIHFAGLKAVGESMQQPLRYFDHNINGSIQLFEAMQAAGVFQLVFSSSATVYGEQPVAEYVENMPTRMPNNTYGYTKLVIEQMLQKLADADGRWAIANLRYFNPIGAHESGLMGEDPHGIPNNLLPFVAQVAIGKREQLSIFGDDYPTRDGTAIRDYIHVMDLAQGHLKALQYLEHHRGNHVWNLGAGRGYSVREVVEQFTAVTGQPINYRIAPRRAGDLAAYWANADLAKSQLGWTAQYDLSRMIEDLWRWQTRNPNGYQLDNAPSIA